MAQICFDTSIFYTVMIVGFSIIAYVISSIYSNKVLEARTTREVRTRSHVRQRPRPRTHPRTANIQRMMNPLIPPTRRGMTYGAPGIAAPVAIPTRGEYGSFQQLGFLHNTADTDQAMPLIGRRIHSNQYEYYTFHHNNPQIKIPIKIQGDREINDGDSVTVYGYSAPLQAKIYDLDVPRYIPY